MGNFNFHDENNEEASNDFLEQFVFREIDPDQQELWNKLWIEALSLCYCLKRWNGFCFWLGKKY